MTFAMWLAKEKITPIEEFYHDPKICDKNGNTVAYYLLINDK